MNKFVKWFLIVAGTLVLALIVFFLYARFYIGVNTPLGDGELDTSTLESQIQLPDGFSMGVYARDIPNARLLRFTRRGDLLVANPSLGKVMILGRDKDDDRKADSKHVLIDGLNGPNGMDFFEDWLYIAETNAIGRIKFDHARGETLGEYERIVKNLPDGENHWKKTLRFGPDKLMYVAMGSSCNVCIEEDKRRAAMMRYQPDGSGEEIYASGMRNSAGFDWSPVDGKIYATDNGRDLLGDNFPPCELNVIEQGNHYGWPFANGDKVPDPDFGEGNEALIESSIAPVFGFKAHNAPLGIEFVRGDAFPPAYQGAAIVALHGSWNRREKDGYKVVSLHWNEQGEVSERDFVSGFLVNDRVIGRPAEVTQGPDGAFYISDDYVGAVYRVAYGEGQGAEVAVAAVKNRYDVEQSLAGYSLDQRKDLLNQGQVLFQQYECLTCHNAVDEDKKALQDIGEKYDIAALTTFLNKPAPPMPVFPLSENDKEALSVYLIESF
jgi:glucose/arabinose dehydrogenase